jgi:hypothetical protein
MNKGVTFVLTSCGRVDLLEKTLESFFKFNTYPIDRYLITEDSADLKVFEQCKVLNQKYDNKLEFIFNYEKLGQTGSIDKAYSMVETEYVFHCEEDWDFNRSGFIEKSIKVLEKYPKILQVWIRPKSDKILNSIDSQIHSVEEGVSIRIVKPVSFTVKGANDDGTDMIIKNYMGFSWNPGLKRLSDWKLLSEGYSGLNREHLVDAYYRDRGFSVWSLSENDEDGYVTHSGWDRRADNPVLKEQKVGISVVMPSFLGEYAGSRSNPVEKFIRAVESFKAQIYKQKELIIISDGCERTNQIYEERWKQDPLIRLIKCEKSDSTWPGTLREVGRSVARYNWICYLDTDDIILENHLSLISNAITTAPNGTTVLFDMYYMLPLIENPNKLMLQYFGMDNNVKGYEELRNACQLIVINQKIASTKAMGQNGTWQIVHHKEVPHRWRNSLTMGEDLDFINRLKTTEKYSTFRGQFLLCHNTNNRKTIWEI